MSSPSAARGSGWLCTTANQPSFIPALAHQHPTAPSCSHHRVVDRLKELIKYKGFQVPPAELEALLLQHPKVVDSGVVGVWDESQATELPR